MQKVVEEVNAILDEAGFEGLAIREQLSQRSFVDPYGWTTDALSQMLSNGLITVDKYQELYSKYMAENACKDAK